tara:strand:- start:983 stop:1243 length:261 start_codon:yes stop_codon:yes gene_type:complete
MKITKAQIKQIIREELSKISEIDVNPPVVASVEDYEDAYEEMEKAVDDIIDDLRDLAGDDPEGKTLAMMVARIVDETSDETGQAIK